MPSRPCSERWRLAQAASTPPGSSQRPSQRGAGSPRFLSLRRLRWSKPPLSPPLSQPPDPSSRACRRESAAGRWLVHVQIASYDNVADADARVVKLKERKMKAYRVAALIRGNGTGSRWAATRAKMPPQRHARPLGSNPGHARPDDHGSAMSRRVEKPWGHERRSGLRARSTSVRSSSFAQEHGSRCNTTK